VDGRLAELLDVLTFFLLRFFAFFFSILTHKISLCRKKYLYNAVFDERTVILSDQFISKIVSAEAGTMTFSKKDHQDVS